MGNVNSSDFLPRFTGVVGKFAHSPIDDRQYVQITSGKRSRIQQLSISSMAQRSAKYAHDSFENHQHKPEYIKTVRELRGHLAKIKESEKGAYNIWWRQVGRVVLSVLSLPLCLLFGLGFIVYKKYSGSSEFEQNQKALQDAMMNLKEQISLPPSLTVQAYLPLIFHKKTLEPI